MAIHPEIALQFKNPQIDNPIDNVGKLAQMSHALAQANALNSASADAPALRAQRLATAQQLQQQHDWEIYKQKMAIEEKYSQAFVNGTKAFREAEWPHLVAEANKRGLFGGALSNKPWNEADLPRFQAIANRALTAEQALGEGRRTQEEQFANAINPPEQTGSAVSPPVQNVQVPRTTLAQIAQQQQDQAHLPETSSIIPANVDIKPPTQLPGQTPGGVEIPPVGMSAPGAMSVRGMSNPNPVLPQSSVPQGIAGAGIPPAYSPPVQDVGANTPQQTLSGQEKETPDSIRENARAALKKYGGAKAGAYFAQEMKRANDLQKAIKESEATLKIGMNGKKREYFEIKNGKITWTGVEAPPPEALVNVNTGPISGIDENGNPIFAVVPKAGGAAIPVSGLRPPESATDRKNKLAMPQARQRVDLMNQNIDKLDAAIKELRDDPGLSNITGTIMGRTPNLTNKATGAQAKLNSIKAQIFVDALQAMREASKTGGAVGSVSDREGDKLERTLAALDQAQSTEDFKKELNKALEQLKLSREIIQRAFDEQYGNAEAPNVSRPAPSTGPKTLRFDAKGNLIP